MHIIRLENIYNTIIFNYFDLDHYDEYYTINTYLIKMKQQSGNHTSFLHTCECVASRIMLSGLLASTHVQFLRTHMGHKRVGDGGLSLIHI